MTKTRFFDIVIIDIKYIDEMRLRRKVIVGNWNMSVHFLGEHITSSRERKKDKDFTRVYQEAILEQKFGYQNPSYHKMYRTLIIFSLTNFIKSAQQERISSTTGSEYYYNEIIRHFNFIFNIYFIYIQSTTYKV